MGARAAGFALAVGATGVALLLALALAPIIHTGGEPLFLLAIAASALIGGLWPGLLSLVLSLAALNWWFIPPERAFGFTSTTDLLRQLIFSISGLLVAVLGGRARALQRWAEARALEAEFRLEGAEGRLVARRRAAVVPPSLAGEPPAELPAELPAEPKIAELQSAERHSDETVLIVDPDAEARQLASRAVEAAGYRWVSACDGVEALELLDRYDVAFALVVTDVGLPDIPGPELMRRIAERRPGLPVLYTSTSPGTAPPTETPPADQPVLEKPFTQDELVRRTRDLLDGAERQRGTAE
jgi:CheY-like chemotaxis protein